MNKIYKLIIITEDKIEYYGEAKEDSTHSICLSEYIENNFNDHPFLGKLSSNTGADSLAYALTYFTNIAIILQETKTDKDGNVKYGSFICLELPPKVSDKLQEQIFSISDKLSFFKKIYVEKSKVEENYLTSEVIDVDNNLPMYERLISAINKANGFENLEISNKL